MLTENIFDDESFTTLGVCKVILREVLLLKNELHTLRSELNSRWQADTPSTFPRIVDVNNFTNHDESTVLNSDVEVVGGSRREGWSASNGSSVLRKSTQLQLSRTTEFQKQSTPVLINQTREIPKKSAEVPVQQAKEIPSTSRREIIKMEEDAQVIEVLPKRKMSAKVRPSLLLPHSSVVSVAPVKRGRPQLVPGSQKNRTCQICHKVFRQSNYLHIHMRKHTGEKPFKCILCGKSFQQKNGLDYHMKVHSGEKPFSCDICLKTFRKKQSMLTHRVVHFKQASFANSSLR